MGVSVWKILACTGVVVLKQYWPGLGGNRKGVNESADVGELLKSSDVIKLDDWNSVIMKLSNEEPEMLLSLLKTVVHMISMAIDVTRSICKWWNLGWVPVDSYLSWLSWFNSIRMQSSSTMVLEGVFYTACWSICIPENVAGNSRNMVYVSFSLSNLMYSLEEQNPSLVSKTHLESHEIPVNRALNPAKFTDVQLSMHNVQLRKTHQDEILNKVLDTHLPLLRKSHSLEVETDDLNGFPGKSGKVSKALTFMETFDRHKKVSNSMDSAKGLEILKPFSDKGFRLKSISPDLNYLFKNTMAESWYMKLIKGAQTLDLDTKNWSRLNNAVMVFDKMHPLVYKFIEEYALTFNGNKWGHNGPYLVSRVVSRLEGRPGYNFTVLPPMAFYPVNWNRVRNLFRGAKNETDAKWLRGKLRQIRSQSYAVHLWNKQSRKLQIEEGSIVSKILLNHCVFCNSSGNVALDLMLDYLVKPSACLEVTRKTGFFNRTGWLTENRDRSKPIRFVAKSPVWDGL
nr:lactosylceramide 4-alpha-galactosyltransferase-like [Tanacetum cinerariifolium]